MDTRQYWNELADIYQVICATTDWLLGYPKVVDLLGDLNGKVLLDFGCTNGKFTRFLASKYPLARVIGVDVSETAIKNAIQKTEQSLGIEYHHIVNESEITKFPFDVACATFVFCTIPNIETIRRVTQLIYDQLPDGGAFVVLEPHPESHGKKFTSFQADLVGNQKSGDQIHVRLFTNSIDVEFEDYYWTRDDYEQIFTDCGFKITAALEPIAAEYPDDDLGEEKDYPPFIIYKCVK